MKIDAGWKFQRRNPTSAPASAKHSTATYGWPTAVVSEMTPSVTAAISPTPDDRPSRPSIQLIELIIPRYQKTLNAPPRNQPNDTSEKRSTPGPNGFAMKST